MSFAQRTDGAQPGRAAGPEAAPGWTTSEFWSAAFVHAITLAGLLLTVFTGDEHGIEAAEAAVPAASVIASTIAHLAYTHARVQLKLGHLRQLAADTRALAQAAAPAAEAALAVAGALDPALGRRLACADADAADRAPAPAPQPATNPTTT